MVKPTQIVSFREFMKGNTEPVRNRSTSRGLSAYSLVITPGMFIDPLFVTLGGAVLVVALCEKVFGVYGHVEIADTIGKVLRFAFPIVAIVIGYIFLTSNPLLHWM